MASERRLSEGMDKALKNWDFYKIAELTLEGKK